MIKVFIIDGHDSGKSFTIKSDRAIIGRSKENDIQINDSYISGRHLEISLKGDNYFIKDLNSSNGTFLGDDKLDPGNEIEINEGIPIKIGMSSISLGRPVIDAQSTFFEIEPSSQDSAPEAERSSIERPNELKNNLGLLFNVSGILTQSFELEEMLEKVLDSIFDLFKRIDRGYIVLIDKETKNIYKAVSKIRVEAEKSPSGYDMNVVSQVLKELDPVMVSNVKEEPDHNFSSTLKLMKIGSVMCIPLVSRSDAYGVIYVDTIDKINGFRKEDLSLLTAIAGPITLAIENVVLRGKV